MLVPSMCVSVQPIRGYSQEICLLVQRTSALVHNDSARARRNETLEHAIRGQLSSHRG